jgi:UDP-N-acetylglucosamine--N-acetylmuramyl-(pentapeptide) pyrophosphoryl-undecaprenol N-acetylglucosamine transferase
LKKTASKYRILFTGGGTGGHLFPAISVAEKVRQLQPDSDILFVGTKHKIEAKVVPEYGFRFKSIWISGFQRKLTIKNILFPVKVFVAMIQSLIINMSFKPCVAIGSGAYVTGPVLWGASIMGAKIMLLEQNSYPGITNRLLENKAHEIHISFKDSEKYFKNKSKLRLTGNPIRVNSATISRVEAIKYFELDPAKKTLLVLGGSLGAASINKGIAGIISKITGNGEVQVIWQTGRNYFETYKNLSNNSIRIQPFIDNMTAAYVSADVVIARAGATTIAETAVLSLPVIFIPSQNVAEDHQYKNAKSLEDSDACVLVKDSEIGERLLSCIEELLSNEDRRKQLSNNIKQFSVPDAAEKIAKRALELAEQY